jgi:LysM domain-containing protein
MMDLAHAASTLRTGLILSVLGVAAAASAQTVEPRARPAAEAAAPQDEQNYIVYELRTGEDPSKVARMFHVTLDELLALNHITDPRRLSVGATLKIPDPRAALVAELRGEKDGLQQQLKTAEGNIRELQKTMRGLEAQLNGVRETNETLQSELALYQLWRTGIMVSCGISVALALAWLVAWGKWREAERRYHLAAKETAVRRAALEKYRQLSAQFELRYQSIFHRVRLPPGKQARRLALNKAFAEDRERMDAILAEAEREIKQATAELSPEPAAKSAKALFIRLSTARKSAE